MEYERETGELERAEYLILLSERETGVLERAEYLILLPEPTRGQFPIPMLTG